MKSLKKVVLLVASLVMALSMMAISVSAANDDGSSNNPGHEQSSKGTFSSASVTVTGDFTYDGQQKTAGVTVKDSTGKTLTENVDYTVTGHKQTNSGTYTITITGKGNYLGSSAVKTFTIKAAPEKTAKVTTGTTKKTVTAAKFKKKAKKAATFTFKSKNKGPIKVKVKAKGKAKKTAKKVRVVRKGNKLKVIMPKGTKKGTYTIKVRVPAYNQYKKTTWKTFKVTVK